MSLMPDERAATSLQAMFKMSRPSHAHALVGFIASAMSGDALSHMLNVFRDDRPAARVRRGPGKRVLDTATLNRATRTTLSFGGNAKQAQEAQEACIQVIPFAGLYVSASAPSALQMQRNPWRDGIADKTLGERGFA